MPKKLLNLRSIQILKTAFMRLSNEGNDKLALAMSVRRQWKTGETLTVSSQHSWANFDAVIEKVREYASI